MVEFDVTRENILSDISAQVDLKFWTKSHPVKEFAVIFVFNFWNQLMLR